MERLSYDRLRHQRGLGSELCALVFDRLFSTAAEGEGMAESVTIGKATLYLGDCRELLPSVQATAIVTDPPYGIDNLGTKGGGANKGRWAHVRHQNEEINGDNEAFDPQQILSLNLPTICWGANLYSDKLPRGGWLVWDKRRGIEDMEFNRGDAELAYCSESMAVRTFRHLWHGLCRDSEVGQHLHPTQKPVALMEWCIGRIGPAETILDPYMGVGGTGVAAANLGRRFVGIEIEPKYFEIACKRIDGAYAQGRLFA